MHGTTDALLHAPPDLRGVALTLAVILAEWAVWIGPTLLICLWVGGTREDRTAAVAAGAAATVGLLFAAALSPVISAPRPFVVDGAFNYLHHAADGGFPSDHATLAFALAFGLLLRPPPSLPRAWLPLVVVAAAVGWARVYLGAHHALDILGGAAVGFAAVRVTAAPPVRALAARLDGLGESVRSGALARLSGPRHRAG
ncbi:phosphatase PAP2 family protein [Lichenibacterium dinghuense]|uniref:phosphatase PAP2 family protein n=1 Tax=Lichenibacterium dinghuense TaxID=2895977 RepID=UPI001F1D379C|nr:phosphatase PAP2 family protein [Lichenibacterium sp. 6Y81]